MGDMRLASKSAAGGRGNDPYLDRIRDQIGEGFTENKIAPKKRNEMGKDDFLKLMSAQLKNQDPMNPLKNEQMAAQLAQFSALEQMMNVNQNLEKMQQSQKPQDNVLAASLIGKSIVTDSAKFNYDRQTEPLVKYDLPADAKSVTVSIVNQKGEIVREYDLGAQKAGKNSVRWDGKNTKGGANDKGEYSFRVNATDDKDQPIKVATSTAGLVTGVVFEQGKPYLLVGETKVPFDGVDRIEVPLAAGANGPTQNAAPRGANQADSANSPTAAAEPGEEKIKSVQTNGLRAEGSGAKINEGAQEAFMEEPYVPVRDEGGSVDGAIPIDGMDLWSPSNN
ncbi:MAG: hypothetical protein HUU37_00170 [Bdellovibrionales bacterium]|nr:hypothetical protein [Bdellovibrionales bacterium]